MDIEKTYRKAVYNLLKDEFGINKITPKQRAKLRNLLRGREIVRVELPLDNEQRLHHVYTCKECLRTEDRFGRNQNHNFHRSNRDGEIHVWRHGDK